VSDQRLCDRPRLLVDDESSPAAGSPTDREREASPLLAEAVFGRSVLIVTAQRSTGPDGRISDGVPHYAEGYAGTGVVSCSARQFPKRR
jgi:hypothetical protein